MLHAVANLPLVWRGAQTANGRQRISFAPPPYREAAKEKLLPLARFEPTELESPDTKLNREWTRMDAKMKTVIRVYSWLRIGQDNPFPLEFCSTKIEDQSDRQPGYSQVIDQPASFVVGNSINNFRVNDDCH